LGIDTVVIAGTGSGKTILFVLLLVLNHEKTVLIISPLNILDQARQFKKWKISTRAVNREIWSLSLPQSLNQHEHQAILTSPKMCLKH
ncbi:hypothetical protein L208DRAFT_1134121, partial [Tricholoma matsutake]